MTALKNTGRLPTAAYEGATMYTTMSPCDMCTGACLLYNMKGVVIGELEPNFMTGQAYLKSRGKEVVVLHNEECRQLVKKFAEEKPEIW